jgi:hypothetical protein
MFALCQKSAVSDVSTRDNAVQAAELFIRANKLNTDRRCPEKVRKQDALRDLGALCPYYSASQAIASEVVSLEEFGWKVYFPMLTPGYHNVRTVDVYPADPNNNRPARVCLRDV